jgi:hypothetical protein
MGGFRAGAEHPRYRNGVTRHPKGYLRITAGPERGKLVHRAVVERCFRENIISPGLVPATLPPDWEIHHMDGRRDHNCPSNLLATPPALHPSPAWRNIWIKPGHHAADMDDEFLEALARGRTDAPILKPKPEPCRR